MSNEFWTEFKRLAKLAERAAYGDNAQKYIDAYETLLDFMRFHRPRKVPKVKWLGYIQNPRNPEESAK